jgi:hypothetical protein
MHPFGGYGVASNNTCATPEGMAIKKPFVINQPEIAKLIPHVLWRVG